jgi:hypothetical protein
MLSVAAACVASFLATRVGESIQAFYFPREHVPLAEAYYWALMIASAIFIVETLFAPCYRHLRANKKKVLQGKR